MQPVAQKSRELNFLVRALNKALEAKEYGAVGSILIEVRKKLPSGIRIYPTTPKGQPGISFYLDEVSERKTLSLGASFGASYVESVSVDGTALVIKSQDYPRSVLEKSTEALVIERTESLLRKPRTLYERIIQEDKMP